MFVYFRKRSHNLLSLRLCTKVKNYFSSQLAAVGWLIDLGQWHSTFFGSWTIFKKISNRPGVGKLRPARPFHATRRHLQKLLRM